MPINIEIIIINTNEIANIPLIVVFFSSVINDLLSFTLLFQIRFLPFGGLPLGGF